MFLFYVVPGIAIIVLNMSHQSSNTALSHNGVFLVLLGYSSCWHLYVVFSATACLLHCKFKSCIDTDHTLPVSQLACAAKGCWHE